MAPLIVALLTIVGLVAALVGGSRWAWLTWLLLSVPPALLLWHLLRRRTRR